MTIATGVPTRPKNLLNDLARLISPSAACTHEVINTQKKYPRVPLMKLLLVAMCDWACINELGFQDRAWRHSNPPTAWVPTDFVEMVSEVLVNTEVTLNAQSGEWYGELIRKILTNILNRGYPSLKSLKEGLKPWVLIPPWENFLSRAR